MAIDTEIYNEVSCENITHAYIYIIKKWVFIDSRKGSILGMQMLGLVDYNGIIGVGIF